MSEMVERVARAICQKAGDDPDKSSGKKGVSLGGNPNWRAYEPDARAAIEAMREPTEAMQAVGYVITVDDETEVWQAMIDAALDEPSK